MEQKNEIMSQLQCIRQLMKKRGMEFPNIRIEGTTPRHHCKSKAGQGNSVESNKMLKYVCIEYDLSFSIQIKKKCHKQIMRINKVALNPRRSHSFFCFCFVCTNAAFTACSCNV